MFDTVGGVREDSPEEMTLSRASKGKELTKPGVRRGAFGAGDSMGQGPARREPGGFQK